ncbi:MAG: enoyl-[acyl-carrier-protein] reductase FabK [bacterium]|nr:enoyl-[acyl-carrier-protein] reductase FabK [bacterium]
MLNTTLCKMFGIEYPVILGGMAFAGDHALAAAVSEAGGLGVIGSGSMSVEELEEEINNCRKLTSKPFGVNCFIKDPFTTQKAEVSCRLKVAALFTGIGNPGPVVQIGKDANIPVIPTVATVKHARSAIESGADVIVAEGQEGGGHIGTIGTLPLIAQVRAAVGDKIPIVAAGGIGDGSQLVASLTLGAIGVMMGTRFLVANECPVHNDFKNSLVNAGIDDTTVTGHFTGFPMRCLRNDFTDEYQAKEKVTPSIEMLLFGRGKIVDGLINGNIATGSLPAGQVIGQINKTESAAEIIKSFMQEAETIVRRIVDNDGFDDWK